MREALETPHSFWEQPLVPLTLSFPQSDADGRTFSIVTARVPLEAWGRPPSAQRAGFLQGDAVVWGSVELLSPIPYPQSVATMRFVYGYDQLQQPSTAQSD